jgi:hypothetical protein
VERVQVRTRSTGGHPAARLPLPESVRPVGAS